MRKRCNVAEAGWETIYLLGLSKTIKHIGKNIKNEIINCLNIDLGLYMDIAWMPECTDWLLIELHFYTVPVKWRTWMIGLSDCTWWIEIFLDDPLCVIPFQIFLYSGARRSTGDIFTAVSHLRFISTVHVLIWEWCNFAVQIFQSKACEANHLVNSPGVILSKRSWRQPVHRVLVMAGKWELSLKSQLLSIGISLSRLPNIHCYKSEVELWYCIPTLMTSSEKKLVEI